MGVPGSRSPQEVTWGNTRATINVRCPVSPGSPMRGKGQESPALMLKHIHGCIHLLSPHFLFTPRRSAVRACHRPPQFVAIIDARAPAGTERRGRRPAKKLDGFPASTNFFPGSRVYRDTSG